MNELIFYAILKQIIEAYPQPQTNNAGFLSNPIPQIFCVITNPSDLETTNYGKIERHKNKPFYFNRNPKAGQIVNYPVVSIMPKGGDIDLMKGTKRAKFSMLIEDLSPIETGGLNNISQKNALRVPEEVHSDLSEMANAILREAYVNFVKADITPVGANPPYTVWASKLHLSQLKQQGDIVDFDITYGFADSWANDLKGAPCLTWGDNTAHKTIGYLLEFSLDLDACPENKNFDYKPFSKNLSPIPSNCC